MRTALFVLLLSFSVNAASTAQVRAPIHIALRDSAHSLLEVDSANWSDAWISVLGDDANAPILTTTDLSVWQAEDTARILAVDSIAQWTHSRLSLSFVLDNSGSMFDTYDSLTKYLDTVVSQLPSGVRAQAVLFDNIDRSRKERYTRRSNVLLALSGFRDSIASVQRFWHYYDTVRVAFTPFFDAIRLALENIGESRRPEVVIAVTDGEDNASESSVEDLGRLLKAMHVRLILITLSEDNLRMKWLARVSGGSIYSAYDTTDLRNLLHDLGLSLSRSYHVRYQFPSLSPSSPRTH